MTELSREEFETFFEEINGYPPFHWQSRLAEEVIEDGWPESITLPTGAGKTSTLEIAIYHLAMESENPGRSAPTRIFHTIDRRVVVDQAYEKAKEMAKTLEKALKNPEDYPITSKVAEKLEELGDKPLEVERLRGGLYTEETWANSPTQPAIIATTIDQIGSRLLFRGYGVSDKMKPIHAALVGNDSLIILDEAHLANPFLETLEQIKKREENGLETPFQVVSMSATLGQGWPDKLSKEDRENPKLGPRLDAEKAATLEKLGRNAGHSDLVQELVDRALDHVDLEDEPQKTAIGVIVNTVRTARQVYRELETAAEEKFGEQAKTVLVIGRSRPYEREDLDLSRVEADRPRGEDENPFFVVATQTIEVGADLDFDAIVTEIAPLDALRQRFGRLDRMGEHGKTNSTIITDHDWTLKTEEHPIYGENLDKTWKWLEEKSEEGSVDMGLTSLDIPQGSELEELCAPKKSAPTLLTPHLELLAQTKPRPEPEPEISLYLHGPDTSPDNVRVIWRQDLPSPLQESEEEKYVETLSLVPPSTREAVELPIWAVKRWLSGAEEYAARVSDVEGATRPEAREAAEGNKVLAWRGPGDSEIVGPDEIRPGDTLIVPSQYGGHDYYGFNPESKEDVLDVAERAGPRVRKRPTLRLVRETLKQYLSEGTLDKLEEKDIQWQDLSRQDIEEILETLKRESESEGVRQTSQILLDERGYERDEHPMKPGCVLTAKSPKENREPEGLEEHSLELEKTARGFVESSIIGKDTRESIVLAAKFHDLGKLDPRFQQLLYRGDPLARIQKPLAKSSMRPGSSTSKKAKQKSGYPSRQRHEAISARLSENNNLTRGDNLAIYLIGTHHGYGRPLFPVPSPDEPPILEKDFLEKNIEGKAEHEYYRIDSGWPELFWDMINEYGFWGISYLEAFVRLSDRKVSSEGGGNR